MPVISGASDHSRIAAHTCVVKIIDQVVSGNIALFGEEVPLHIWSDGCAAQFRARFVFYLIARMKKQFAVEWCYNERHHGKGAMDGVERAIKNKVYRDVRSGKVHIKGAKSFAEYADITIRNIKSLYLLLDDVLQEPGEIDLAPKIKSILKVHCVRREFTIDGIAKVKFFKMALYKDPFCEHYYRKQGDPEVCDHPLLPLSFDILL